MRRLRYTGHMALAIQDLMNRLVKSISGPIISGTQPDRVIRFRTHQDKRRIGINLPSVHRGVLTIQKNDVGAIKRIAGPQPNSG